VLDGFGGIVRLDEIGARFESEWPAGIVSGEGIVRLLVRVSPGRAHIFEVDGADQPLVLAPHLRPRDAQGLRRRGGAPGRPVAARRARHRASDPRGSAPHFDGDPLALGVRICEDVEIAETGHLFIGPVDPKHSIGFVIDQTREPIALEDLARRVRRVFGPHTPYPDPDHLLAILRDLDCRVQGSLVLPVARDPSIASQPLAADDLPSVRRRAQPRGCRARHAERGLGSRGFRMLVTPPEHHPSIGRSVATLRFEWRGKWVSFEDAFFAEHAADIKSLERAERFVAQREALTEAAEATLFACSKNTGGRAT
jgi:hypothetical protein